MPVHELIDVVWDGDAPATAVNSLQSHVSSLRRKFGLRNELQAHPPGYVLQLTGEDVDATRFDRLISEGKRLDEPWQRVQQLRAALLLWRERPLSDLVGLSWMEGQADRLERLRRAAFYALTDARLCLGEHAQLVPELQEMIQLHPYDELLQGQLMIALYRNGQQVDALQAYGEFRHRLAEELGLDPSPRLREIETAMLRQETWLAWPRPQPPTPPQPPAQLPAANQAFTGRHAQIQLLDQILESGSASIVVSGMAGVGKTTLAVHWAHRRAHRFPDGQVYADLRGFGATGQTTDPAEALRGFLEAFGVQPQRVPPQWEAQVRLLRDTLAGKRVLILLDNVRDTAQTRLLLPGFAGCLVLITSREAITGHSAVDLDPLPATQAHRLLTTRLGRSRMMREPQAARDLIRICAGLPLALAIVAARAGSDTRLPLARLAVQMGQAANALNLLDGGDDLSNVRTVFSWSLAAVSPSAARLFRALCVHPGPEVTVAAAASLAGITPHRVRPLLAELVTANLLIEHVTGRFSLHDLLRMYAGEQAAVDDCPVYRIKALERVCEHYVHTAHGAAVLLGADHPIELAQAPPDVVVEQFGDYQSAMDWFAAQRQTLAAMTAHALAAGLHTHTWQLAWAQRVYLSHQGLWLQQSAVQQAAVTAARQLDDPYALAHSLRGLAYADAALGRHDEACERIRLAVECFASAARLPEQALALLSLARLLDGKGDPADALTHAHRALEIYTHTAYRPGMAYAFNAIGWCHARLGHYDQALIWCTRALTLHRRLNNREGQSFTLDSLGYIHHHLGDFSPAIDRYRQALALFHERGDRSGQAETSERLGDSLYATGRTAPADAAWQHALELTEQIRRPDHPDATRIKRKLAQPPPRPSTTDTLDWSTPDATVPVHSAPSGPYPAR